MDQDKLDEHFFDAVVKLDKEYASRLLEQGADVQCYNNLALHQMIEDGHKDMVEFLVKNSADVNSTRGGDTALYTAINHGHNDIADYLIENGADVKAERNAALSIACQNQDFDLVKKMISLGADSFNDFSSNVAYAALHSKESLKMIVEAYSQSNTDMALQKALNEAIANKNNDVVKAIFDLGLENEPTNQTAFVQAVKFDNKEIVNYLLNEKKITVSDKTRTWLSGLSDPTILGHESERYSYAEHLIEKRDLNEKLQANLNRPTKQKLKSKGYSLKI